MQTHKSGIEVVRRRCLNSIPFTICLPCMSGLSVFLSSGGSYFTWQAKVIHPKFCKNSNEPCIFLALDRLAYQGSIENSAITFDVFVSSYFHWQNKYKFRFPTCFSIRTEKLRVNIRKLLILAFGGVK